MTNTALGLTIECKSLVMKIRTVSVLVLLNVCVGGLALAGSVAPSQLSNSDFIDNGVLESDSVLADSLEIAGILSDDTLTRFGHELFEAFNKSWRAPEGIRYNIAFNERNDPLRGSFVTVKLNELQVFEGFLSPRDEAIQELGKGLARDIRSLVLSNANIDDELY